MEMELRLVSLSPTWIPPRISGPYFQHPCLSAAAMWPLLFQVEHLTSFTGGGHHDEAKCRNYEAARHFWKI